MALWQDRRGRFSYLRAVTLVVLIAPVLALLYYTLTNQLGPRPHTEAIHEIGLWGIRFLMVSLAITPLRRLTHYAQLIDVRRMIGVASFLYIALHLGLYAFDQGFNMARVVSEIVLRYYLTIGFVAFLGLGALAATSNDTMVRRLGGLKWRQLHRLAYPIAVLACIHYFMQSKLEVFEPTVVGGVFIWLMLYRFLHWRYPRSTEFPITVIAGTWFAVGALVFLAEAMAFNIAFHTPMLSVLKIDFNFRAGFRPGWYVWGIGLIVTLIGIWRNYAFAARTRASRSPARAP